MPYLDSLANTYGLATNSYADTHPSIGNYEVLAAGQIFSNNDSDTPSSLPLSSDNIANVAQTAGKTWKDYQESTNGCGAVTSGSYYVRHDPLTYFTDINGESANFVCASQFATDIANHTLPNFSWLVPNGCDDAHDCSLSTFDNFLKVEIAPLLASSYFQPGGDGLLIITFDEDGGSGSTTTTGTTDGGQIETVVISPYSRPGFTSSTRYYEENVLATMALGLGASTSGLGAAATAAPMADFFGSSTPSGSVTLSPTSLSFGNVTVGVTATLPTTLSNGTSSAVSVSGIGISPTSSGFTETNNCPSSLGAGTNCTISVIFAPTAAASGSATLSATAGGTTLTASLTGSGVSTTSGGGGGSTAPAVSLSPTSLTFPSTTVGTTSATQYVTLTNTGSATLTFSGSFTISGPFAFAGTGTCSSSVAAGANCTISVNFTPTTSGSATGTVTVTDNASGSPQTIGLTGSGVSSTSSGGGGGGTTGTDFYVSTTGSDSSGTGSSSSPWATIAYASTKVGSGATVHVAAGTYSGSFSTNSSGTSSAYITYISDTKWGAKIVPSSSSTWSNYGAYVAIQNFDVTGPASSCCNAIYTSGNATKIIGNNVHGVQTSNGCSSTGGGAIVADGTNTQIIGNYVHDNGPYPTACNYIEGIYVGNSNNASNGAIVYNNISFRNSGWGIQLWHTATNEILASNTIFDNATGGIVVGAGSGSGVTDDYTTVTNNIVYNNAGTDGGIMEEGTTGTHNIYANNLVFQNTPVNYGLQNGNTATGTVSANPQFVNFTGTTTGDYHLTSSSPAINAGAGPTVCASGVSSCEPANDYDGNSRPQGSAWDIGAYELVSASSVSISPTSLTFASQTVGTASAAQTVTVSNGTSSALSISGIAISGTNSADFAQTNTCGSSVAASGNCTISVTFTPAASGTRTATLTLTPASGSALTVSLTGTGASSTSASIAPTSLTFASQTVGTASAAQTVTVSNGGSSALSISTIAISGTNSGDFAQTNTCGSSVAASGSCTISVTFTPAASGTRTATLTVTPGSGSALTVSLTGTGASSTSSAPTLSLAPASLTFPSTTVGSTSTAQIVTLSNAGNATLTISGLTITGDFAFGGTGTCGTSVAAGASCTISVVFTPTAAGTRTGAVTITDNASGSPHTIPLSGTGASNTTSAVSLSPAAVTFGSQAVGTTSAAQIVTLSNTGSASLSISGVAIMGANAVEFAQTNTCGSSVAGGAQCSISVTFTPGAAGSPTAQLTISDNAANSPQTVALSGTGVNPPAQLSPSSLNFPGQNVGSSSAEQVITLSNPGSVAVTINGFAINGDYAQTNNCGNSVAAASQCTIHVIFKPTASGTRNGTLTITDSAGNSPQSVAISGVGEDFSLKALNTSQSVSPGTNATYLIGVAPLGGFNQAVSFECSGAPTGAACSVSPNAMTLDGAASATANVTVTTTSGSLVGPATPVRPTAPPQLFWPGMWVLFLGLVSLGFWRIAARTAKPQLRLLAPLFAILLSVGMWSGCGAGSLTSQSTKQSPATAAGTYTLTLKATSENLSHSVTVTLQVK